MSHERRYVSNHRQLDSLFDRLLITETSKPVLLAFKGYAPVTGGFPSQKARNAENVSILWNCHGKICTAVAGLPGDRWLMQPNISVTWA